MILITRRCDATTFTCNIDDECLDTTLNCDPNEDCIIECTGENACELTEINCPPSNNACNILCNNLESCLDATINASLTYGSLNMINNGWDAAGSSTVKLNSFSFVIFINT